CSYARRAYWRVHERDHIMRSPRKLTHPVDLSTLIRAGDTVWWSQGPAEPQTLVGALLAQRHTFSGAAVFMGLSTTDIVGPEHADHLSFKSYRGLGSNRVLHQAGVLDLVPCHYSQLPVLIERDVIASDV